MRGQVGWADEDGSQQPQGLSRVQENYRKDSKWQFPSKQDLFSKITVRCHRPNIQFSFYPMNITKGERAGRAAQGREEDNVRR